MLAVPTTGLRYAKGHGTENDFVIVPDPHGELDMTPELVRALCDRRSGVGGDGVLRVVAAAHVPAAGSMADQAYWFMDYHNADGSIAEMCGNGVRVYARYLLHAGLARSGELRLATRGGLKQVSIEPDGDVIVEMGAPAVHGRQVARIGGRPCDGVQVSMGNPHLVCLVDEPLDSYDLSRPPEVDAAAFPDGVNVEVATVVADRHAVMRVHERGVGETRSCGTGACAVAAVLARRARLSDGDFTVDLPGGRLEVTLENGAALLCGPAVVVADGELTAEWLAAVPAPTRTS